MNKKLSDCLGANDLLPLAPLVLALGSDGDIDLFGNIFLLRYSCDGDSVGLSLGHLLGHLLLLSLCDISGFCNNVSVKKPSVS